MHAEQYLTTYELNEIDPSGRARSHIQQLKGTPYRIKGNIFIEKASPEKIFGILQQDITKLTASKRFYKYAMWVLPTFEKVGPQGGRYEYSTLLKSLEEYYTPRVVTPSEVAERGLQLLLRAIREVKQSHADATWSYQHVPVVGTSAGLPSMSKKGQYYSETTVEPGIRHLLGAVPGERVLKGKPRTIFMDANGNIRMIEDILGYVRAWLKRWLPQFFTGWKNPDFGLRQMITDGLLRGFKNFETDQTSMDQHFSKSIVELYIAPIYEAILPPDDFIVFQEYVSECFEQKLFMGDRFWTGLHNLFSGIGPTNEFETVFQLLIFLGGLDLVIPASPFHIAVNGDDVGLLVKASDAELHELYSVILAAFKDCDFEISETKSRIDTGDFSFCKKYYSAAMPKTRDGSIGGAYSPAYVANSIVYPEHNWETPGQSRVATLQILDNAQYSPSNQLLLDWASTLYREWTFNESDLKFVSARDWWFKVYGESWDPAKSWSFGKISTIIK